MREKLKTSQNPALPLSSPRRRPGSIVPPAKNRKWIPAYAEMTKKVACLLLTLTVLMIQVPEAIARCVGTRPGTEQEKQRDDELASKAAFIGLIEIKKFEFTDEKCPVINYGAYQVTANLIQPYKGTLPDEVIIKGCYQYETTEPPKLGKISERVVLKNGDDFMFTGQCQFLSENRWKTLRKNATISEELKTIRNGCVDNGGILTGEGKYLCSHETKDFGNVCRDHLQCESLCVAELSDEEKEIFSSLQDLKDSKDDKRTKRFIEKNGTCSRWKEKNGCYYLVERGVVSKKTCYP